jgi:hypothetical protein
VVTLSRAVTYIIPWLYYPFYRPQLYSPNSIISSKYVL